MSRLRIGVIGTGRVGDWHARIAAGLEGCRLAGIHDVDAERARGVAERLGTVHFASREELFAAADAVVVAVPTRRHHEIGMAALAAGCHALIEKPLATCLEEADELLDLAALRGLALSVGHVERFNPAVRASAPYLSKPRFIESRRLAPFQPRGTDVPVVLDLMIHDIDLVLGLVRERVASVQAMGIPVLTDSVDIANARLRFENGTVADISASRVSETPSRHLRIFQPSGYLTLDLASGRGEFLRRRARPPDEPSRGASTGSSTPRGLADVVERIPLRGDSIEPLRMELEAFVAEARAENGASQASAQQGRAALEIAIRIERDIRRSSDVFARNS